VRDSFSSAWADEFELVALIFPRRSGRPELAPCLMVAGCRGFAGPDPSTPSW